jgi:hypothetical protein
MRLEAELGANTSRYTHLVDDDETVVTFATGYSGEARMVEAREAFERVKTPREMKKGKSGGADSQGTGAAPLHDFSYKSLSETVIVQRVRSAAKVMLAPCVPPSFFGPETSDTWQDDKNKVGDPTSRTVGDVGASDVRVSDRVIAIAGSDMEDEGSESQNEMGVISHLIHGGAAFRSPYNCPVLHLSVKFDASNPNALIPLARAEFVYESLLLLWLRSISDGAPSKDF